MFGKISSYLSIVAIGVAAVVVTNVAPTNLNPTPSTLAFEVSQQITHLLLCPSAFFPFQACSDGLQRAGPEKTKLQSALASAYNSNNEKKCIQFAYHCKLGNRELRSEWKRWHASRIVNLEKLPAIEQSISARLFQLNRTLCQTSLSRSNQ